ncbi:PREDICTED: putative nuclease HARBI1 [Trachymyrmex cornetzi]|uniref:putative nuclease HARBI1 n=1 Tax=Trachymyrmex cornetzi TaxID=471704 RepID=UPI00084F20C7|nr:PREDICTED: putative nuclease HARBI1 [Trachymyrmex cornetzi]
MRYRQQALDGMLVGDGGYPALPFLLTPIANPITDEEIRYNIIHGRTRRIVERTFGIWKIRFPCLSRGLKEEEIEDGNINEEVPVAELQWQAGDGFIVRNALIERLFR